MADISQIKLPNNTKYNINVPLVEGTGTTAGTWLGTLDGLTEYYDGLMILYKINIKGASTTTLNLNSLGAKTCYIYGTIKLNTQYPVNSIILLVYSANQNGGCWMCASNYYYTYFNMTASELVTGTATSARTVRADYLKQGIEEIIGENIDDLCSYSTSEHRVGTWVDGKPIYEITIKIDSPQYNTTDYVDAMTINNVDVCISTASTWYRTLSGLTFYYSAVGMICPEKASTNYQIGTRFRKDISKVQYFNAGYGQQMQTVWITTRYTKTTD